MQTKEQIAKIIMLKHIPNGIQNIKGKGDGKPQYAAELAAITNAMVEAMELYASQRQGMDSTAALTEIETELGTVNLSSHTQMKAAIETSLELTQTELMRLRKSEASPTSQPAQGASKLDLLKMETNFSDILEKETSESLNQWLADSNIPTGPQCTCENDQKGRALCPVCDKEEYDGIKKAIDVY